MSLRLGSPDDVLKQQRDERIAELETRIRRRSPVGVKAPVALLAVLAGVAMIALQWQDVSCFFSSRTPIDLGSEDGYRFEALTSNRYAQVHGIPTLRGAYWRDRDRTYIVLGLRGTPLLVRREALPGEEWLPGKPPPQPNQSPFAVRGRLLAQVDASRHREAFDTLRAMGEVRPRDGQMWILLEGQRPGADSGVLLSVLGLALFIAVNAYFLWRALSHRLGRP